MKNKNQQIYLGFLFCLTIIITLIPFFNIGFTTGDDLEYYLTYLKGETWNAACIYAQKQGRFFFYFTQPFNSIPYLFDNFYFTKIVQYGTLILSYLLFTQLVYKIFKSKTIAGYTLLLLIMNTAITFNNHIPFIAYPFYFTFSFCLCLISVLLFIKYTETCQYKYIIYSAILFFITLLFYEAYLIMLFFMCLYIFIRSRKNRGKIQTYHNKTFYKEILPFILIGILYVILYFSFKFFIFQSQHSDNFYEGSSFAKNFSWSHFFDILLQCTIINLPFQSYLYYQENVAFNTLLITGHQNDLWYILTHAQPIAYINALIQCFIFVFLTSKIKHSISWKKIGWGLFIALLVSFAVHILIGISEKYNSDWYRWMKGYVTSYYSYFFTMLFIILCLYALIKLNSFNKIFHYISIVFCSCLIFSISIITNYTNDNLSREWIRSQHRFVIIDHLIEQKAFDEIPTNAIVYIHDLYHSEQWGHCIVQNYSKIDDYIILKSKHPMIIANTKDELVQLVAKYPNAPIYYINQKETVKNTELLLSITQINKNSIHFSHEKPFENANCQTAAIYYYSPTKDFTLWVNYAQADTTHYMIINSDTVWLKNNDRSIAIKSIYKNNPITALHLQSETAMKATQFTVSNMIPDSSPEVCIH